MTRYVTKATSIHFIVASVISIKKLKWKSTKTCLTNHIGSILHHWLLMPSVADTHTNITDKSNFNKTSMSGFLKFLFQRSVIRNIRTYFDLKDEIKNKLTVHYLKTRRL